ncbi:MAG: DNA-directed RNA polymerase subunit alpha [bacterium]|nr:DNA-directed RNA polymerase subunit alpha [bacterium]
MEPILLPSKFEITSGAKPHEGVLVLEPCFYGYGTTVGNALRRVLLSSLSGAAVTAIKLKGAQHEFSTIPYVKEDVLEIILNLKKLRIRSFSDEPIKISMRVTGEQKVTAAEFGKNAQVEIVNPELVIATVTDKKGEFDLEITIEKGRGYVPTESRPKATELGVIMIDALFSPVRTVGYRVENARVGEITNYDRLIMTIETDGTVTPEEAVKDSAKILLNYFSLLLGEGAVSVETPFAATESASELETVEPEEGVTETLLTEEPVVMEGEEEPKKKAKKSKKK